MFISVLIDVPWKCIHFWSHRNITSSKLFLARICNCTTPPSLTPWRRRGTGLKPLRLRVLRRSSAASATVIYVKLDRPLALNEILDSELFRMSNDYLWKQCGSRTSTEFSDDGIGCRGNHLLDQSPYSAGVSQGERMPIFISIFLFYFGNIKDAFYDQNRYIFELFVPNFSNLTDRLEPVRISFLYGCRGIRNNAVFV